MAVITTIAIQAIIAIIAFFGSALGAGFYFKIFPPEYCCGFAAIAAMLNITIPATFILTPILSIYPVIKIAGPIFATAKNHWNKGD
ncbi:MAG: hypothetical protein K1000chlam3_01605 [Chlamydiae bacterium]|nr:hypothetical protein [Chlamydiota bacterium]